MRLLQSLAGRVRSVRAHPLLNPLALEEMRHERRRGHAVSEDHAPHLEQAIEWLVRAQDATPDDGFARSYSLVYSPYFRRRGWSPSYPETTGYIIPTLLEASRRLDRPELADRAIRAARWESAIQMESGAVQGGVIGEGRTPAVFNTGQVLFGWLAALDATGDAGFADSARRAGKYLVAVQDSDGHWRQGNSNFARKDATLYNARVAWALAEAGKALKEPAFVEGAAKNLRAVAALQHPNGWFPRCCLTDDMRPLLHTIAYTIRGLLEGGRVLEDEAILASGIRAAEALLGRVREDGWMAGRFLEDWSPAVEWSCLTGEAQMANNWMRLRVITGENRWLEPVPRVLSFVKRTQNRTTMHPGLRGGIKGSSPVGGGYGKFELLNWATKYFADALMRHQSLSAATAERPGAGSFRLA